MVVSFARWQIRSQLASVLLAVVLVVLAAIGHLNSRSASHALSDTASAGLDNNLQLAQQLLENQFDALDLMIANLGEVFATTLGAPLRLDDERPPRRDELAVPLLYAGDVLLNDAFSLPDRFTKATGAVATVFVRIHDDFLRITTSLTKDDGSRALGTWLGQDHPGYRQLLNGQPYVGYARLFGKDYVTRYQPVRDDQGRVIALLFVGADISAIVA